VLFAESLMDLSPWNYWTPERQPREFTLELLDVLEDVMESQPDHVGANHFYIHAVELPFPDRGVPAAERLHRLAPDAGHLVHMPSHIFWRVGRYDDALEINRRAAKSDEQFFATCRPGPWYRAAYYPHNLHFLWAAAAAEGRSEIALSTARQLEATSRPGLADYPFLEETLTIPTLTLVRFGRWDAVLGVPQPDASLTYLTGIWHYARGLALVRSGRASEARAELGALAAAAESDPAQALLLSGGVASAAQLLAIGRSHLEGELAATEGDVPSAIAALEDAVERQDAIPYMEPPPWYFPTRQALGAVLLDAKRSKDAEAVYRTDLEQYPRNGWSLHGLARSLREQGKRAEAEWAQQGFANAWARADVALTASRF
jgi:tetratricopeptide (TPR) repeat protein